MEKKQLVQRCANTKKNIEICIKVLRVLGVLAAEIEKILSE